MDAVCEQSNMDCFWAYSIGGLATFRAPLLLYYSPRCPIWSAYPEDPENALRKILKAAI